MFWVFKTGFLKPELYSSKITLFNKFSLIQFKYLLNTYIVPGIVATT